MIVTAPALLVANFKTREISGFPVTGNSQVFLNGDPSRVEFVLTVHPAGSNCWIRPNLSVAVDTGIRINPSTGFERFRYQDFGCAIGYAWSCITDTLNTELYVLEICWRPKIHNERSWRE